MASPIIRQMKTRVSHLPRSTRILLFSALSAFLFLCFYERRELEILAPEVVEQHVVKDEHGLYRIPKGGPLPSVNLVVAATSAENYDWVKELKVPGMTVVPYIADNTSAVHHAQKNKGHEAMMYHQYFYDFYDNLPDITILVHSQAKSWHIEGLLDQSMIFSLNRIDLREIQRRGFLNLRVTWGIGCSTGSINTTRVNEESGEIPEQKEMQEAFRANFNIYSIPEILATPCCSQIAVTKELIRKVPREQYAHHINWLLETKLEDNISGRTWEHMWQYLFLGKSIDCPIQHKAYCRLYHICFGGPEEYDEWIELSQGRDKLQDELKKMDEEDDERREAENVRRIAIEKAKEENNGQLSEDKERELAAPERNEAAEKAREKMRKWLTVELEQVKEAVRVRREVAMVRGAVEVHRTAEGEALYGDEVEMGVEDIILPKKVGTAAAAVATGVRKVGKVGKVI